MDRNPTRYAAGEVGCARLAGDPPTHCCRFVWLQTLKVRSWTLLDSTRTRTAADDSNNVRFFHPCAAFFDDRILEIRWEDSHRIALIIALLPTPRQVYGCFWKIAYIVALTLGEKYS